ncbi:MAG: flavodoxin-dependent (E)-4-hydroxy-3-methylbut-2-enyl-diphosphate synthase [Deltaproteobacteria bacterium]|nr:flavodoxin-dependent (E)-4-hydroxy-3-methylbut-2-enyl-diphosphate synthase [Deltaproteobacteria bacterium]
MDINRSKTRRIYLGGVPIGDGAPVSVQSMANTDTRNVKATVRQIRRLERAGCEIGSSRGSVLHIALKDGNRSGRKR